MKILIVEDETVAYENLTDILTEIDPSIEIMGNTESVTQTVNWLQNNQAPDLILMDIHLSDGSSFSVFDTMEVKIPIIFTTAYDEYAIDAVKVNSVDYLLKRVKVDEFKRALHKLSQWTRVDVEQYLSKITKLAAAPRYRDKLLIPVKDRLLPINLDEITCFYTTDKTTRIYLKDGSNYTYSKTLDQIMVTLNPTDFIRANKQYIISRDSVKNITIWFDNRLLVTLDIECPERSYISKNKASEFKAWVVSEI